MPVLKDKVTAVLGCMLALPQDCIYAFRAVHCGLCRWIGTRHLCSTLIVLMIQVVLAKLFTIHSFNKTRFPTCATVFFPHLQCFFTQFKHTLLPTVLICTKMQKLSKTRYQISVFFSYLCSLPENRFSWPQVPNRAYTE